MKLSKLTVVLIALALLIFACSVNHVRPGEKPQLSFNAFGSQKHIGLANYRGKIVIVDFWATWCGPCMAEAGHVVAINEKYSSRGVQLLGVSLDSDPAELSRVIAEKKFTWPMAFDGKGWESPVAVAWGVDSIPQTFIIGPDGDVLWRGHPSEMDGPLEKALVEHPPQVR